MRALPAAVALAIALGASRASVAAEPAAPRSLVGAAAPPAGHFVVSGEGGLIFIIPTLSVAANVGVGGGVGAELRYRNIAGLGHAGKLRLAWATHVDPGLVLGVALRTSITSLAQADGKLVGVQVSNLAIGNDWLVGGDLSLTWLRPGKAHLTVSLGPTFTLGGLRYTSFDDRAFRIEPAARALTGTIQGEWEVGAHLNVFVRLDADVLLHAEILPLGFIPTGTIGFGWAV
jgi:hypothetical protein